MGRAPALQTNKDITSPQVNHELVDTLEEATKVEQENDGICYQKHWAVHEFEMDKLTTYEDVKNHGIESACPMIDADEYKRLLLSPRGDYNETVRFFMAAQVLNPLVAVDMCSDQLVNAIRDLSLLGFDEFRHSSGVIKDLNDELSTYCAVVNSIPESFWSEVEGAAEYNVSLKKKAEKNPEKYGDSTWEDDRIEKAHMV